MIFEALLIGAVVANTVQLFRLAWDLHGIRREVEYIGRSLYAHRVQSEDGDDPGPGEKDHLKLVS